MSISYHKNAKTTVLMRRQIKESSESIESLAKRLGLNKNTGIQVEEQRGFRRQKLCAS